MTRTTRAPLATGGVGFWALLVSVVVVDLATKLWAEQALLPRHVPHPVFGDVVRLTLSYNPGAAFGMSVGPASRWFFGVLAVVIIFVILRATKEIVAESRLASIGVPLILGGAVGNLIDRVRSPNGVVDFIDIGVEAWRFWTFNVADSGVTIGAACLLWAIWRLEH